MGDTIMVSQKRVYNALATFGQISVGLQGLSCIAFAAFLLVIGGTFLGTEFDLVPAVVDGVSPDGGIAVTYRYHTTVLSGTFPTIQNVAYSTGDVIYIRVNPTNPTSISEDLPYRSMGLGLMTAALALGYLSWYAIHIVSDDKNVAALAGSLSALRVIL